MEEGEREAGEGMGDVESRRESAGGPPSGRGAVGEILCGRRVASETRREGSAGMVAGEWGGVGGMCTKKGAVTFGKLILLLVVGAGDCKGDTFLGRSLATNSLSHIPSGYFEPVFFPANLLVVQKNLVWDY